MTDIELLKLPDKQILDRHLTTGVVIRGHSDATLKTYALACTEHNVEKLRMELDRLRGAHMRVRRERNALAKALLATLERKEHE